MKQLNETEYADLIQNKTSFLIEFSASWCSPCSEMARLLESMEGDYELSFFKIDVDDCPTISELYGVRSIPTLVLIKEGELVEILVGMQRKDKIDSMLRCSLT